MISGIFWVLSIITVFVLVQIIILRKDWFSIYTYIVIGVYIPLFLSFCNWSDYHIENRPFDFYLIFIMLDIACLFSLFFKNPPVTGTNIIFTKNNKSIPVEIYNLFYVICILIENYAVSGYFIPQMHGVDVHTERVAGIYFITTAVYIFTIINILEYLSTRKKIYIIYAIVVFVFNTATKSSRIDAALAVVQIVSFCTFYYLSKRRLFIRNGYLNSKKKSKIPLMSVIVVLCVVLISVGIDLGNNRMNFFGRYQTIYEDGIKYTGPRFLGETLTYYYGYFAMSFDNLAYNVENTTIHPNFIGLNSFRAFYFGILQFDNLFGFNGSAAPRANIIRCRGAAVTTGFWDFYYDYSILVFIPFVISFIIAVYFRRKIGGSQYTVSNLVLYFYWIPLWMFMSFDNRVYDYQVIWQIIIICIVFRKRYSVTNDQDRSDEELMDLIISQRKKRQIIIAWKGKH